MKKLLTLAVATAMTLSVAAASATTLKLSEVHAEGYPTTLADQEFARLIEERTEGRIKVEVYSGQLYMKKPARSKRCSWATSRSRASASPVASYVPALNASDAVYKNADHMWAVPKIGWDMLAQSSPLFRPRRPVPVTPARSYYTTKQVSSVADMKGLKIRMRTTP
ncbi:MAG: TRAP transporter substrate-binding protein [Christensenellales bacterium]